MSTEYSLHPMQRELEMVIHAMQVPCKDSPTLAQRNVEPANDLHGVGTPATLHLISSIRMIMIITTLT